MNETSRVVNGLRLPPKKTIKLPPKKVVHMVKHEDNGPKSRFFHSETGEGIGPLSVVWTQRHDIARDSRLERRHV